VISDQVGIAKPDPRIFQITLEKTGLQPSEVVYVGDSVEDIQGSQAAGIHTILIRREKEWETWGNYSDLESTLHFYKSSEGSRITIIKSLQELQNLFQL
jgi:FMN phosphatase YigB (HAD superfamily)